MAGAVIPSPAGIIRVLNLKSCITKASTANFSIWLYVSLIN